MFRFTSRRGLPTILLAAFAAIARPADVARAAELELRNPANRPIASVPVSFGQVFRRGEIPGGMQVQCPTDAAVIQVDPKRTYNDGSLRFAVVSAIVPALGPADSRKITLRAGKQPLNSALKPVDCEDVLATSFEATVTLAFPDGTARTASARNMLEKAGAKATTWLRGPVVTEWLLTGPPVDQMGQPDTDLLVQFQVRAYARCKWVRVSVVVENCWDTWAGNIRYDATVTVEANRVFKADGVDHRRLSRWRKVFWWGEEPPGVHVVHDTAYLSASGALPHYDRSLQLPESSWKRDPHLRMQGPRFEVMGRGSLTAYMPTTGGRPEIAPYPTWTVFYLLTMSPQAKALVLANGDLAGSWPIHVRSRETGHILTIDQRPKFWLDGYRDGQDKPEWKDDRHPSRPDGEKLSPDIAHQGSFAYVPYLVTGDFYYLEEAYFWGNSCLLKTWPHQRKDAQGLLGGQIRGNAWGLRNVADAGWIAPDGDPEATYFDQKIRNNIADRIRRMRGPPEYNRMGFWGLRTVKDARIHNAANQNWMVNVPWELDYLTWSFHHLVELAYGDAAKPRDFLLRQRVGMLTNRSDFDPMLAAPYRCVVGERTPDGHVTFYEDWKKLGQENAKLSKPGLPNYGNSYAYSARAAAVCGIDGDFPRAAEAVTWLEEHLPDHRAVMARNPAWAIVPGGAAARLDRIRSARVPRVGKPIAFNTPEADTICSALQVFPPDNAWNLIVADWPLHPRSGEIVASVGADKPLRYNPDMGFVLVPPDQRRVPVSIVAYPDESDPGPFPVPDCVPIEGWPVTYRRNTKRKHMTLDAVQRDRLGIGGDRHAIIVDPSRRMLYEFYQMKRVDSGWQAAQASVFDLKTNRLRPAGWTSADAAGLPIFPAVVRYDELGRGKVEHAMRVTIRKTRRAYVAPATHYASRHQNRDYPRMGERFRLRRDFDVAPFSPEVQAILRGLKEYGMLVADNGIEWAISVAPDPRIPDLHEELLRRIRGRDFEVVTDPR